MKHVKRGNHFVSQKLLKQWSHGGSTVWAYRILVSHEAVPEWTRKSIRGIARHQDLYTTREGEGSDSFERWLETHFETPAHGTLDKVIRGDRLSATDWERLALFLAAQDVRTPSTYIELMSRWEKEMPALLDETLKETVGSLEQAPVVRPQNEHREQSPDPFQELFRITVTEPADEDSLGSIKAEVVLGRSFWLASQRHLLTKTSAVLRTHKWSIVQPAPGFAWFITDHPVIRLNYYENETHDLGGGWGNPGTELMMPLSPQHLLFTHVGQDAPDRLEFSADQCAKVQRFLAQRADRWIFSSQPGKRVAWLRPRHVDAAAFRAEEEQWRTWHERQNAAEESNGSEAA